MNDRLKSIIATAVIHVALGYLLFSGLVMSVQRQATSVMNLINIGPETPPPPNLPPPPKPQPEEYTPETNHIFRPSYVPPFPDGPDWMTMTPMERLASVQKTQKWVVETVKTDTLRPIAWRMFLPQGSGPSKVTRTRPPNLTTHTLYWPASWSQGPLPIIVWGNGSNGMCFNNSLGYAAFLSEIASHGYFVVAVGNDDIDYPQPNGSEVTPDGRSIRHKSPALKQGVDWAIEENGRAGSPYQGKLDTSKIAYMGHSCGGQQALEAAFTDPRATTIVLLNSAARFTPRAAAYKAPIAFFMGWEDDGGVLSAGDASFDRAQAAGWPMVLAALIGMGHDQAYPEPNKRWNKAVLGWLDWQLKGDAQGGVIIRDLWRDKWTNIGHTGL